MVCVVIMAGGRGERFWPKSRWTRPKQFMDLTGSGSLLYLTYKRAARLVTPERIFVVTGREYRDITRENLPELPAENIIIEPAGRNTAPCIGLAATVLRYRCPGATMIVVPADHLIKDEEKFTAALATAARLARHTGGLVTLGIRPTRPETGYGYVKTGAGVELEKGGLAYQVSRFVEKPDAEKARQLLADGGYLWNAGIFIWDVSVILEAFRLYLPDIYAGLLRLAASIGTDTYEQVLESVYPGFPKISIDYGIMEKAAKVYTVPGDFHWDDVGTWKSLERVFGSDANGNVIHGNVIAFDARNTIVDAGKRLVAVIGAENLIVVDTEDITFICHKDRTDQVRELLRELRSQKMEEYL